MTTSDAILNIDAAKRISTGFMSDEELLWLADAASRHSMIAEVGSWTGRSTRALCDNCPGTVFAIDHWRGTSNIELGDILAVRGSEWAYEEFLRNLAGCSNLIPMRGESTCVASLLADRHRFDMIFIDGAHDEASVRADILSWSPLLAPGGLLCGHDFHPRCPGVIAAVTALVPGFGLQQPADGAHTIWWKP